MFIEIPANKRSSIMRRPLYGVGINDAAYITMPTIDGKKHICPFYKIWRGMIQRTYSKKFQVKHTTYKACMVADEWLLFSNFRAWAQTQDWEGKEIDKDILYTGNKLYSPRTCIFVPQQINVLLTARGRDTGKWPVGVYFHKNTKKFMARCKNGGLESVFLGYFNDPEDAYLAYCKFKSDEVRRIAGDQELILRLALLRISKEIESGEYYKS